MRRYFSSSDRSVRRLGLLALIATELLMSFSFFGYFHIEPISITIAYIPVLAAGALMGPPESAVVGAVFGLASMWKASASYVMDTDKLFSPLYSGDPLGSVILSVGSRMLFGLTAGLLYMAVRNRRFAWLWVTVISFFGRVIHSLMVFSTMALFFPEAGYRPKDAFSGFFSPVNISSSLIATCAVLLLWAIARSGVWQRFRRRLAMYQAALTGERYHVLSLVIVFIVTMLSALAVTFYFVNRIYYVLSADGIQLSDTYYGDISHLQVQFLFGILSLMVLVILFLILNRRYTSCMSIESRQDSLTGLMTRRAFFSACGQAVQSMKGQSGPLGYFIMIDLDHFKEINDNYGHPEGDRALKETAHSLKEVFRQSSFIGRMGGDEFAVLVYESIPVSELDFLLRLCLERIRHITWDEHQLCCSIGALQIRAFQTPEELYLEADRLLYEAKEKGRNQYVIKTSQNIDTDLRSETDRCES